MVRRAIANFVIQKDATRCLVTSTTSKQRHQVFKEPLIQLVYRRAPCRMEMGEKIQAHLVNEHTDNPCAQQLPAIC